MEHTVHLGAGHFVKIVLPTSARALVKKIRKAFRDAQLDDDNIDFDALEVDLGGNDEDEQDEQDEDNADDEADDEGVADFTVGDTIGKSLTLVKQVSTSMYTKDYVLIYTFRSAHHLRPLPSLASAAGRPVSQN